MMNKNTPLVSVIIPAYKHERFIQSTIQSIIDQTYNNIELIIGDDGSPDNTWEKIIEMQKTCRDKFSNVILIKQKNSGLWSNYNSLITKASGDYTFIVNSDDQAAPTAISRFVDFLEQHPDYSMVVGDNAIIDDDGKIAFWDLKRNNVYNEKQSAYKTFADYLKTMRSEVNFNSDDFGSYPSLLKSNYIPNGYLVRKKIYEKTGLYTPEAPLEDIYMALQISKHSKIKYIDEVLFYYRWHDKNTIKVEHDTIQAYARQVLKHEKTLVDMTGTEHIKKMYYAWYNKKEYRIKLGSFFKIYKIKNFDINKKYLELFGKKFLLYSK